MHNTKHVMYTALAHCQMLMELPDSTAPRAKFYYWILYKFSEYLIDLYILSIR